MDSYAAAWRLKAQAAYGAKNVKKKERKQKWTTEENSICEKHERQKMTETDWRPAEPPRTASE